MATPSKKGGKEVVDLNKVLKDLQGITDWFESQKEVDLEQGLEKVREAAALIKVSKKRLEAIENEFEEIKKDVDVDDENEEEGGTEEVSAKDLPF